MPQGSLLVYLSFKFQFAALLISGSFALNFPHAYFCSSMLYAFSVQPPAFRVAARRAAPQTLNPELGI